MSIEAKFILLRLVLIYHDTCFVISGLMLLPNKDEADHPAPDVDILMILIKE